jgi:hypothetical protein
VSNNNSTRGWLTGWANSKPVAIQLATRRAFLPPPAERNATSLAPSATELAVVTYTRDGNKVRRYRLD